MWTAEHTALCSASRQEVWSLWSDAAQWPHWNPTIAEVSLQGPFVDGTRGTLKPAHGPRSKVVLRDVHPGSGFADVARLPGAEMRVEHEVVDGADGGSRVTERAVLSGPLARVWSLLLGRQLQRDMAAGAEATARTAESGASG
ncbi:MAG TPA: SRPBCC family protein [Solirubrobacteraceae bacterium]|jgi:uncharacterized protein YndB with AHSA1/START domain